MNRTLLLGLAIFTLGGCGSAVGGDDAFGRRVRDYLMAHPEVIQQALQKQEADAETAIRTRAREQLPRLRAALERDPRDFVANPQGKVTVTEFYDYRCPHCVNIAPKITALVRANPNIRFVFKETPIFGATSQHAARAALAVKAAGGDYLGVYETLMAARGLDDAAIDKIALAKGARATDLAPTPAVNKQLADVAAIFDALKLDGTPAFVVGDSLVFGEDLPALSSAIEKAGRASPKS